MSILAKDFADTFARYWSTNGGSEIQGRIAGRLMLDEHNGVSAAQHNLAAAALAVLIYDHSNPSNREGSETPRHRIRR